MRYEQVWKEAIDAYIKNPSCTSAQRAWVACQHSYDHTPKIVSLEFFTPLIDLGRETYLNYHLTEEDARWFTGRYDQMVIEAPEEFHPDLFQLNWNIKKRFPAEPINQPLMRIGFRLRTWGNSWQSAVRVYLDLWDRLVGWIESLFVKLK